MLIGVPFLLIAEQPDLGTSLLVLASGIFVLFLSGLSWRMIGAAAACAAIVIPIAWEFLLHDYQRQRVLTLLDPEADALGTGWNIIQSKTAIGSVVGSQERFPRRYSITFALLTRRPY